MRILLVTGKLAEKGVRETAAELSKIWGWRVDVAVLNIQVAALMTPRFIELRIGRFNPKKYDYVVVPGMVRGPLDSLTRRFGSRFVKGTMHYLDLPEALMEIGIEKLSSSIPADMLLSERAKRRLLEALEEIEGSIKNYVEIGGCKIPSNPPPLRVAYEVVNAETLSEAVIKDKLEYAERIGVDIVVLGFNYDASPKQVSRAVRWASRLTNLPIGVDTRPANFKVALEAGAELFLSLTSKELAENADLIKEKAVILTPNPNSRDKVRSLARAIRKAVELGFEKIIADPILDPPINPGTLRGLTAAAKLKQMFPEVPVMLGAGNVTELIDADSPGVNALISTLSIEAGASILMTVEASHKTRHSAAELKLAATMASIAARKKTHPKNLGIDLLILKEKRGEAWEAPRKGRLVRVAETPTIYKPDPKGYFKISVTGDAIRVVYQGKEGAITFEGRSAAPMLRSVLEMNLVSQLDHAAYLGYELSKAEIALKIGKTYTQDRPLFHPNIIQRIKTIETQFHRS